MALDLNDKTVNGHNLSIGTAGTASDSTSNLPFAQSSHAAGYGSSTKDYHYTGTTSLFQPTGDFTLETWIKTTQAGNDAEILASYRTAVSVESGILFGLVGGSQVRILLGYTSNFYAVTQTGGTINDGNWRHVAANRSGTLLSLFIDDVLNGTVGDTNNPTYSGTWVGVGAKYSDFIGGYHNFFNGTLDDIRFWSGTARTVTEIANNASVELTGNEGSLVAYWPYETELGVAGGNLDLTSKSW